VGTMRTYPGPIHTVTGVATSITARIDQRAEQISFADDELLFDEFEYDSELGHAVRQVFSYGGSQAYVTGVLRPGGACAQISFAKLTVSALTKATWPNGGILVDINYNSVDQSGAIADPVVFNLTGDQIRSARAANRDRRDLHAPLGAATPAGKPVTAE
jgi:hypothetical protein